MEDDVDLEVYGRDRNGRSCKSPLSKDECSDRGHNEQMILTVATIACPLSVSAES